MKIAKVINNNVISAFDESQREIIAMGRGLGFRAKEGDRVAEDRIEKVFRLESGNSLDQFKELLKTLPMEHVQVSDDIIRYANSVLNHQLNPNVYLTLTDHINFALERFKKRMKLSNPLLREVRCFYRQEYLIGEYAVALIERKLGIRLPVDEAASIAIHIVNAEYDAPMGETIRLTGVMQEILELVQSAFQLEYDEHSLSYERFLTHLRFLAQQVLTQETRTQDDPEFQELIGRLYAEEYACGQRIRTLVREKYGYTITDEEAAYLALHIRRIRIGQGEASEH